MADFDQSAKGGPFAKFSKWPIFGIIGMYGRGIYSSF